MLYLVGCPHSGGLRHPFSGVDTRVDPDSRTLRSSSAELNSEEEVKTHAEKIEYNSVDKRLYVSFKGRERRNLMGLQYMASI